MEEKRQLMKLVLSNTRIEGRKVLFEAQKPFNTILDFADRQAWLPSPEILIRITQSVITAFSDSVSFESVKNKWIEIKKIPDYSSPATLVIAS